MMHAGYIQRDRCSLDEALDALDKAIADELEAKKRMNSESENLNPSHFMGTVVMEDAVML